MYIIFGCTIKEHCKRLDTVLLRLRKYNLRVKLSKCTIAAQQVSFLEHVISASRIHPDPAKLVAVSEIPRPITLHDIHSFLGLTGYYRKFIPNFASIASPFVRPTENNVTFWWSEKFEDAFVALKSFLCSAPILALIHITNRRFRLRCLCSPVAGR